MNATKWFKLSGLLLEVSGLLTVAGALIPGSLDPVMGGLFVPAREVELDAPARLGVGIAGAIMAGWGAIMVMLGGALGQLTPAAVGRAFLTGTLTWFVLDGAVSLSVGAYLNLPGNLLYLVAMAWPAWALMQAPARGAIPASAG